MDHLPAFPNRNETPDKEDQQIHCVEYGPGSDVAV